MASFRLSIRAYKNVTKIFCRTTNENEMGRFAKLLLRLPGEILLINPPVANPQLPILDMSFRPKTISNSDLKQPSPHFFEAKDCLTSWYSFSSCNLFNFAALRSIGLRCMEHLFFLRIVGEVSFTSHIWKYASSKYMASSQKLLLYYFELDLSFFITMKVHHLNFSGEHQRDWLASLWFAGGRPGLNWDLWHGQKWSEKVPAVKIARPEN